MTHGCAWLLLPPCRLRLLILMPPLAYVLRADSTRFARYVIIDASTLGGHPQN